jgi:class 3 adenylate cyclase
MPPSEDDLRQVTDTDLDKVEAFSKTKKTSVLVVFFDDMKGSSVLKQQMTVLSDENVFQDLRREHDELLTQVITRDGVGEVIKSTGDGLLAVFTEPSIAVERALEIQEKLYRHPYIHVRIGLDMGQVRAEAAGGVQRDLFGRHVDWAARAESLADGGHILVTRSVYTDAFGWIPKPRVSWKEHGFYVVKDGEPAMEVFEPYDSNISNITGPLERLHGKKVSEALQHSANHGIRTFLTSRAKRFLLASMGLTIVVLSLVMYVPQKTSETKRDDMSQSTSESPKPSLQTRYPKVVAELTRFERTGEFVTVVLTLRNIGEEDLLQLICPTGKFPHQESKLEVKQAKLIDQATGESWEPFNAGGSLWDWCNTLLGRDQSLGAWMTFKVPDPGKKTFSFSLPILNGSFNHLGLSGRS